VNTIIALILPGRAAALAFALTPLAARVAVMIGAIDMPGQRKIHNGPTPRLGGLAVVSAIAAVWATGVWLFDISLPRELSIGLSLGALPILAVSALDDVRPVGPGFKFLAHVVGASIAVAGGVSLGHVVHLFDVAIPLGVWATPLSIVWLVGVTNAFNLIDGLDGLSAGLALIASLCMAAVFVLVGQPTMAGAALVLAGALAGFLPYNLHPPLVSRRQRRHRQVLPGCFALEAADAVVRVRVLVRCSSWPAHRRHFHRRHAGRSAIPKPGVRSSR
jgi:UDP-GlcNAc:undecaprenyl-phosphate GlcNAc-1-phosphate transferase